MNQSISFDNRAKLEVEAPAWIANIAFLFVAFSLIFLVLNRFYSQSWLFWRWDVADWLISYESGLVRRGLIGEVLSRLATIGVPTEISLSILQLSLYFICFVAAFLLFVCRERNGFWLWILLCPAFLAFPVAVLLGPFESGAYRKEIIVFAIAGLISMRAVFGLGAATTYISVAILYVLGVFSHEVVALSLPLLLVFLFLLHRWQLIKKWEALAAAFFFSAFSALGIVFAFLFAGNLTQAFQICRRSIELGYDALGCGGAMMSLFVPTSSYTRVIEDHIGEYLSVYPIAAVMVFAPLIAMKSNKLLIGIGLVYFFVLAPIYFVAIDWGRWIHISTVFLYLTVLIRSYVVEIEFRAFPSWIAFLGIFFWELPLLCLNNCHFTLQAHTTFSFRFSANADEWNYLEYLEMLDELRDTTP